MNQLLATTWDAAVETACTGLHPGAARRRRRAARLYADWCRQQASAPEHAGRDVVSAYLDTVPAGRARVQARSEIRKVLAVADPEHASRAIGLGDRSAILREAEGTPLGELVRAVAEQAPQPAVQAVRRSALGRLFTWAAEVGVPVLNLTPADLPQFRRWVVEVGSGSRAIAVAAKDFLELRHSPEGRRILGELEPVMKPSRVRLSAPLQPRFSLEEVEPRRR